MGGGLYHLPFSSPPRASGTVSSVCLLNVGEPVAEDSFVRMCRWVSAGIRRIMALSRRRSRLTREYRPVAR